VEILKKLRPKKVLSIAGCSSRLWPLAAHGATQVWGIDLAAQQLMISRLRLELIKSVDHKDFLIFMGFPPYTHYDYRAQRKKIFSLLQLDAETKNYFQTLLDKNDWGPLLYLGKWEKTFATLAKVVRTLLGKEYRDIFEFTNL